MTQSRSERVGEESFIFTGNLIPVVLPVGSYFTDYPSSESLVFQLSERKTSQGFLFDHDLNRVPSEYIPHYRGAGPQRLDLCEDGLEI